jgi:molecular chaperone HscB
MDHFEVFGLPRRLGIDAEALQRQFYELSRRHHPDFHHGAAADEQAAVLAASARLNAAYRTLRDPITRADYLVRLEEGRETREGATERPPAPPDLLAEMFEIQEALAEARAGGLDEAARADLAAQRQALLARLEEEEARLAGPLSAAWDAAALADRPQALAALKQTLAKRAYLRTVVEDLSEALGDAETAIGHGTHHRH